MPVEHEDCTYSDHEFDHTAEEVATPELPPGHGSRIYTEEEWEAIEDHYYSPTMAEEGFRFRETLADGDESLGAQGKSGRSSVAQTERPATAGDTNEAGTADSSRPHRPSSDPSSPSASASGAGPTGCLALGCDTMDGRTRAGGVRCNDCEEDWS